VSGIVAGFVGLVGISVRRRLSAARNQFDGSLTGIAEVPIVVFEFRFTTRVMQMLRG